MVNCVGYYDNTHCAGGTAVWDEAGELQLQLGEAEEALLIWDSETGDAIRQAVPD